MIRTPREVIAEATLAYCQAHLERGYRVEVVCLEVDDRQGAAAFALPNSSDALLLATYDPAYDVPQWWLLMMGWGTFRPHPRVWPTVAPEPLGEALSGRHAGLQAWQDEGPQQWQDQDEAWARDQRSIHGRSFA